MSLKNAKVLVTGADGFIGSHLVETLVKIGCCVKAFVKYNTYNSWGWLDHINKDIRDELEVVSGDICDPYFVRDAVKGQENIFHLAALIGIPYSYVSPKSYIDTNITGTLNLLQAANDFGISKFIHTSTSEVYGSAIYVPITENHPLCGQSPYSATKIGADQIAMSFFYSFDCPVVILRPFNNYGPRQSARAFIPTVITQLLKGVKFLNLGALSPTRDFVYVKDTVMGFVAAAEVENPFGEVFNIGSNFEISMEKTLYTIMDIMGTSAKVQTDDNRLRPEKSEVMRLWADNTKSKNILGWKPKYSGLDGFKIGLSETIEWFKQKENQKYYKSDMYNI